MNLADITKKAGGNKKRKRVGRGPGSGRGKTATRGHKGAGSRAGSGGGGLLEGGQMPLFRRIPKRGFSNAPFRREFAIVNVSDLEAKFESGTHVTAQALHESGLIRNRRLPIKVLGNGAISKKLNVEAGKFSKSAEEKITAAGGTIKVI